MYMTSVMDACNQWVPTTPGVKSMLRHLLEHIHTCTNKTGAKVSLKYFHLPWLSPSHILSYFAFSHPSSNQAWACLTFKIRQDQVHSEWWGNPGLGSFLFCSILFYWILFYFLNFLFASHWIDLIISKQINNHSLKNHSSIW